MFSLTLPLFNNKITNPDLLDSLSSLELISGAPLKILEWGDGIIAVPIYIDVDLPSKGNFEGIDIRAKEPVILILDTEKYPYRAPIVLTDRLDFPKNHLAHLYVAKSGRPPALCYVRGNTNEWYANKRIEDLIIRLGNWFRDAATGELTEDGDQFEPLRLESYSGHMIYDYNAVLSITTTPSISERQMGFAIGLFEYTKDKNEGTYRFERRITPTDIIKTFNEVEEEQKKQAGDLSKRDIHIGYILWNSPDVVNSKYEINLPTTWDDFLSFCSFYGIETAAFEELIKTFDKDLPDYFRRFPVVVGIRRPKPVIGFSAEIEFVNFVINILPEQISNGNISSDVEVKNYAHNQPLTKLAARKISGVDLQDVFLSIVFGVGALGSKITMHLARSGNTNLVLVDPDSLSSHNLVRHSLTAEDVGKNKAESVANKIKAIFPTEGVSIIDSPSVPDSLLMQAEGRSPYGCIYDFTASEAYFNKLAAFKNLNAKKVISAFLSDFGQLGIMFIEGKDRLARIDDLQAYLYSLALSDLLVREWLIRENAQRIDGNLVVRVGVGCNSETTVLSDETVSSHAAYFAGAIRNGVKKDDVNGKIYLNKIENVEDFRVVTQVYQVPPFSVYKAANNTSWQIRLTSGIIDQLTQKMLKAGAVEVGGVFVGVCNYKTKTIHITGLVDAPLDSKQSRATFIRGTIGLSAEIEKVETSTGGQLGYIGEWHSHPEGPNFLSLTDLASVVEHKKELETLPVPLPVLLCIITPDGFFPHVF